MAHKISVLAIVLGIAFATCAPRLLAQERPTEARSVQVSYSYRIPRIAQGAQDVRVWVPLASSRDTQQVISRRIDAPYPYRVTRDPLFGNEMLFAEGLTASQADQEVRIVYEVRIDSTLQGSPDTGPLEKFLRPSRLMRQDERIKLLAQQATAQRIDRAGKARGIYDYVINSMTYDKLAPGWGKGDSLRACSVGRGNCTDFHSLFISMAHAARIPARFKIGFQVPDGKEGEIGGYHCWAEYHDPGTGWRLIDASEAWKHPELRDRYFGGFDASKFILSMGRDIHLAPRQAGEPVNIFFYPYVEADGLPHQGIETSFSFKSLES